MSYKEIPPHDSLSPFVECYWTIESSAADGASIVFPDGCCDLIWNLGEQLPCTLVGAMSEAIQVPNSTHSCLIGVRFHPGALYPLLQAPMQEHRDRMTPLQDVFGKLPFAGLGDCPTLIQIESALLSLASKAPYRYNDVLHGLSRIQQEGAAESVHSLAKHLRMSTRSLERKFKEQTGLGPKEMMRILRFRKARLLLEQKLPMEKIVERCGYYDQSHFYKDVQALGRISVGFLQDSL